MRRDMGVEGVRDEERHGSGGSEGRTEIVLPNTVHFS